MADRLTHDEYFLAMLKATAARGTCVRRQVGAIIVDEDNRILGTGYNGPPKGLAHCIDTPCPGAGDQRGDSSRCHAVHAEVNAVLNTRRMDLARCIYVTCTPCFSCAKMICNTSIKRIVSLEEYADVEGMKLFQQAGIAVVVLGA